jgi:RHS repeat-associated protein
MERGEEGGTAAYYNYSADGERNIKLTSPRMLMSQNASMYSNPQLIYPTLYASPLITLTQRGYTKHYFEEDRRVCSRLGGGFRGQIPDEEIDTKVEVLNASYENLFKQQQTGIHNTFGNCIGAKPIIYEMYDLRQMLREYVGDEKSYFYHNDHLGSAAYLTSGGDVTQTLNYLPYGEDWIDVQFNLDPRLGQYTFNGKEKDYESGFHYYGARYYWSEVLTGWLSVDPMADKYPNISPYVYCAWNPVKAIDPSGMDSVHTPNGMANVGIGYRATEDGLYLYGSGLQPKKWNPDLEFGGVVGSNLQGGYEDCDKSELPIKNNVAASPIAIPISTPVILTETSILSEVFKKAISTLGTAAIRLMGVVSGCLLLSGDTRPTQEMSQHGGNNVKLSPEEVIRCQDILSNPKSTKKERTAAKQKLKTHEKAEGTRQSRQSKEKKAKR